MNKRARHRYLQWTIPWGILTLVLAGLAVFLMIWGIVVFAKLAGLFLGVGMLVLVVISVVVLIKNGGHGGRQERQAGRAMTWRHHGGVSDP